MSSHKKSFNQIQIARAREGVTRSLIHTLPLVLVAVGGIVLCPGDILGKAGGAGDPVSPAEATYLTPVANRPGAAGGTDASGSRGQARLHAAYAKLPLRFEANRGQTDPQVKFLSRGIGYTFFLTSDEAVMVLRSAPAAKGEKSRPEAALGRAPSREKPVRQTVLRMRMVGANPAAKVDGLDALAGKSNYFIGNDPQKWRTGVPSFARVKYAGIYPGIDLVFHGNQRQLEYDFVVAPGADPGAIRLLWKGAKRLEVDSTGDLVLHVAGGRVVHHAPIVYQRVKGTQRRISGSYVVREGSEVGFRVAAYDRSRPLVIDPVLVYSTYLGGSGSGSELGWGIAVDGFGNAYVTGETDSTDFPVAFPWFQFSNAGGFHDAFVAKLNAAGSALTYSTYLGGSGNDRARGIAVDGAGNAYVTGGTDSTNFPTVNPIQAAKAGGNYPDVFVAKLDAAGAALTYSTYLGGGVPDYGIGIAVDGSGNAYVTGYTSSSDFPTAFPLQAVRGGGITDAFVAKLNAAGSALTYSTFLGGSGDDYGSGIAADGAGNAYVTGGTDSTNFPTASPLQAANGGDFDGFVAKLNGWGSVLTYSTYLGGDLRDWGHGIAVDGAGNAYVTGETSSSNFPTANPFQAANAGGKDAFVAKLFAAGSVLMYSTYLGGDLEDIGHGIAMDGAGNAYVTGETSSSNFPTANPFQAANAGTLDAFVANLNTAGSALAYSTFLGGSGDDYGSGIAVDGTGNAYVTGKTSSSNFPTVNPIQAAYAGGSDAFVSKLSYVVAEGTPALSGAGVMLFFLVILAAGVLHRWHRRYRGQA